MPVLPDDITQTPQYYVGIAFLAELGDSPDDMKFFQQYAVMATTPEDAHDTALRVIESVKDARTLLGIHVFPVPANIMREVKSLRVHDARIAAVEEKMRQTRVEFQSKLNTLAQKLQELQALGHSTLGQEEREKK